MKAAPRIDERRRAWDDADRATNGDRPRYFVTLEREDGSSREYRASRAAYSEVLPGQAGFAFLTRTRLWEYRPYRIR